MSTAYIYNGFQDDFDAEGNSVPFVATYATLWFELPFGKTTPIPDWTLREVDMGESTGGASDFNPALIEGPIYKNELVSGERIAQELTVKLGNNERGVLVVSGRSTGTSIIVHAGIPANLHIVKPKPCPNDSTVMCPYIHTEVREREATEAEKENAAMVALQYKKKAVQEYLQAKRERLAGGIGPLVPNPTIRRLMVELGIDDIDDIAARFKQKADDEAFITKVAHIVAATIKEADRKHWNELRKPRTRSILKQPVEVK